MAADFYDERKKQPDSLTRINSGSVSKYSVDLQQGACPMSDDFLSREGKEALTLRHIFLLTNQSTV